MSAAAEDSPPADDLGRLAAETIARGSRSFAAAARLFDAPTRRSITMLYTWCRHCDDIVDGQHLGFRDGEAASGLAARERLAELREQTRRAFAGEPVRHPAFRALREVALRHSIPQALAFEHLEGFGMDVEARRYETVEELLEYCYRVAGVVGVMMAMVMGARDPTTLDRACDLGIAFQLTNIARDVVEDAGAARVYLPEEWLRAAGISPDEVAALHNRAALARLAGRLVDLAEPYYASALVGLRDLPLRSAWAIATAHGTYRQIGVKVRRLGAGAWDRRVSTTPVEKLRHVARGGRLAAASRRAAPRPRSPALWTRPR